jgi:HEAT repeat protein
MASRGYVQHKGKYVTPQELELLEKSAAEREAERQWYTKLIVLVRWLGGSNERQRQQAVAELREITDPAAVWGLASHMARHQQPGVRRYLVEILAGIPGVKPAAPLVELSLYDEDAGIRSAALDGLREEQYAAAVAGYVPALQHSENAVVNRAGAALGRLGDVTAAPALIDALVTQHSFQVQVPVRNAITVVNGPYGAQFSDPNLVSQYLPPDVDLALRAGQLPFGVQVISPGGSSTTWRTYRVQAQLQNVEVLTALQSLTGQDFGYDERTWKLWWAAEGQKLLASRA